ncbi:hypothetical protein M422DRAFT_47747 [Sphaerobolus stellatus SS14]|uniref:Uncharacterized protein n=1 Tax=Sphaerobolus stellatus (strain SS14) TaxID=990650 RepID=A0A0C9UKM5_SPHS4|nr:hypothetical protein M422DRAFT_47747 [Sphaerobolus stellatus SS14]
MHIYLTVPTWFYRSWCARLAGLRCSVEGGSDMKNWLTGPADRWVLSLIPGYMTMIGDSVFAIAMNNDLTVPADSWLWTLIAAYTYLWMVHSVLRFTLLFLSPLHRSVVRVGWIKVLCRRSYVTPVATYMVLQTGSTYNGVFTIEIYLAVPTLFYRPVMICSDDLFTIDIYRVVPIPFYNDTYGIHIYLVVSIPIYRLPVFYTAGLCYSVDGRFTMSNELTFPTDCRCAQLRTQCLSIDVLDHSVDGGSTVRFHFAVLTDCWCLGWGRLIMLPTTSKDDDRSCGLGDTMRPTGHRLTMEFPWADSTDRGPTVEGPPTVLQIADLRYTPSVCTGGMSSSDVYNHPYRFRV